jgi:hypothetical protein
MVTELADTFGCQPATAANPTRTRLAVAAHARRWRPRSGCAGRRPAEKSELPADVDRGSRLPVED